MPEELLKPGEAARMAEKFVRRHMNIDANKQRIETSRSMLCHSDELGQYYQVEGKVGKIRDTYSSVLEPIFNGFFRTGNSTTLKEYFF